MIFAVIHTRCNEIQNVSCLPVLHRTSPVVSAPAPELPCPLPPARFSPGPPAPAAEAPSAGFTPVFNMSKKACREAPLTAAALAVPATLLPLLLPPPLPPLPSPWFWRLLMALNSATTIMHVWCARCVVCCPTTFFGGGDFGEKKSRQKIGTDRGRCALQVINVQDKKSSIIHTALQGEKRGADGKNRHMSGIPRAWQFGTAVRLYVCRFKARRR